MWLEIIIISLWGGVVALDTTAAFQLMISQPLVSCTVVGLVLGNHTLGFICGIILQLIWLDELPVGAAKFSEGNVGATAASAIAILTAEQTLREPLSISLALLSSLLISTVGGNMVIIVRKMNGRVYNRLLAAEHLSIGDIARGHLSGLMFAFLLGFFLTGLSVSLFALGIFPWLIPMLPEQLDKIMAPVGSAFLGIGCGILIHFFGVNKNWWLLFLSLIGGSLFFFMR